MKCFVDVPDLDVDGFKHIGDGKIRLYKGGGGGGPQTTTSYSTNLPEYAKPYYEELLKQTGKSIFKTDAEGNVTGVQPYQPYTNERIAGFTPEEKAIQQQTMGLTTRPEFGSATQGLTGAGATSGAAAGTGLTQAFGYQASPLERLGVRAGGPFGGREASYYMSPFQMGVSDVAAREVQRRADLQNRDEAMASIGRGTFGGARQALMQAERERGTQQAISDIYTRGQQASFESAQQQFERDRAARMRAQESTLQAEMDRRRLEQQGAQFEAGLGKDIGLAGLGYGIDASKGLGALGATAQKAELERLAASGDAAAQERLQQQERLDLNYQQEMEKRNYERGLLEYYSNILRGTAGALGSTQVQYQARPSLGQQAAGLGIAGLGAYLRS
jgi:hypothetical protein